MAGAWGANLDELQALSASMDRAGQRLSAIAVEVQSSYSANIWDGPDAESCRSEWEAALRQQLTNTSARLDEAAKSLNLQLEQQRVTSADASGSPATTPSVVAPCGVSDGQAASAESGGVIQYLANRPELTDDLQGGVINVLDEVADTKAGVAMGTWSAAENFAGGEYGAAALDVIGVASDAGGPVVSTLTTVGLATYEMYVPVTSERQDALIGWAAEKYGAENLVDRYSGLLGYGNMLHDSVLESVENDRGLIATLIGRFGGK